MFDGKALKRVLAEKGIRQADLAKMTNIPRNTINSWLQNIHSPTPKRLTLVAAALEVSTEALMVKEAAPPPPKAKLCFCPNCGVNLQGVLAR